MRIRRINSSRIPIFVRFATFFVIVGVLCTAVFLTYNNQTHATASGSSFQPGRIIDDAIFTNSNSMNVSQIQTFLNSKVSSCDTQGTLNYTFGGVTQTGAAWAQQWFGPSSKNPNPAWASPPFTCLKDYSENGLSAAQIIYNVAQQYQINPQVLIVLLQKEQGLVTDTWPTGNEYQSATGYGCPDTAACSSTYYGFTNQMTWSGTMFRAILNNSPNWYTPYVLGNNSIQFNPSSSCGSTTVNITNRSTQALYNYTPYQPNAAAMAAGYGYGDSCSAYGNLHFYLYFNDWFGNSILANLPGCDEATNTSIACIWRLYNPGSKEYLTASNSVRDTLYVQNSYQYVGKAFFGNVVIMPGNIPVYRLTDPTGGVYLTTDQTEYNSLVVKGYTGNGIDFYADPPGGNSGYPVRKLYDSTTGNYVWTGSTPEYQQLLSYGYTDEGQPFSSIDPINQETPPASGKLLVYRFYIPQTGSHFWTTDLNERDSMIRAGYDYEGVAWYSSSNTSDKPVYRLYAPTLNQHLYTTDLNEKAILLASGGWIDEGVSEYVSPTPTASPVYRLYAPSLATHLYTQDPAERSRLIASGGWNDEGVAWYQP